MVVCHKMVIRHNLAIFSNLSQEIFKLKIVNFSWFSPKFDAPSQFTILYLHTAFVPIFLITSCKIPCTHVRTHVTIVQAEYTAVISYVDPCIPYL